MSEKQRSAPPGRRPETGQTYIPFYSNGNTYTLYYDLHRNEVFRCPSTGPFQPNLLYYVGIAAVTAAAPAISAPFLPILTVKIKLLFTAFSTLCGAACAPFFVRWVRGRIAAVRTAFWGTDADFSRYVAEGQAQFKAQLWALASLLLFAALTAAAFWITDIIVFLWALSALVCIFLICLITIRPMTKLRFYREHGPGPPQSGRD